jgi:HAD superfamily hydrolase (TIGR01509 family)
VTPPPSGLRALVVDWGGVLTEPLDSALRAWAEIDGLDLEDYVEVMRGWLGPHQGELARDNPVAALERGEIEVPDFEVQLARRLSDHGDREVVADGLLTGLLSNSWGNEYPREGWDEMFDAIVISGEVGMRKPEPEIFAHVLGLLGVAPGETVFVDDLEHNVHAAEALGLVGVHHTSYDRTVGQLEALFGLPLGETSHSH